MTLNVEGVVDCGVGGEKSLGGTGAFEALHLAFSSAGWLMPYNRIPPAKPLELGRELMLEHPDIDTLIYACPHWATIESIEPLEQEFGINVITALQAIIWEGLRLSGVPDTVANYGRLLREH